MGQPSATYDNICDRKRAATWIFPSSPFPSGYKREKQQNAQGKSLGRRRRGSWLGAGCSRRWRFPGAGRGPGRPLSGCSPSPDSTHFSEPRKHNEPGRSADLHRGFKVAICLQLSLSPQALRRSGSKTGKEEGRYSLARIIFKGAEISCSTKAKPAAKKGNHLYFGSLPPRLAPLRLPLQEVIRNVAVLQGFRLQIGAGARE